MKWMLITWLITADCLPQMPMSFALFDTQAQCTTALAKRSAGTAGVCRETKAVASLKVTK
jgi:hypothetical protein